MSTLEELKKGGTSRSGTPREAWWRLYHTEEHGWAVRDMNHFEWRSVLLKDGEKEIHDKGKAIKFLDDNGIRWDENNFEETLIVPFNEDEDNISFDEDDE